MQPKEIITSLYEKGFSVIPVGEKAPMLEAGFKDLMIGGKLPLDVSLSYKGTPTRYGILCGAASNNFEGLDFDLKNALGEDVYTEFMETLLELNPELHKKVQRCMAKTPSGGYHLYYKTLTSRPSKALAYMQQETGKFKPVIETRGDGGYICVPPSKAYAFLDESMSLERLPRLTDAEVECLYSIAILFDQRPPQPEYVPKEAKQYSGDSVFEKFEAENDFRTILENDGYHHIATRGGISTYSRPGAKNKNQTDATVIGDGKFFYPFSTSITEVPETEKPYRLYAYWAYTRYPHLSDEERWKEFARDLHRLYSPASPTPVPVAPVAPVVALASNEPTLNKVKIHVLEIWKSGQTDISKPTFIDLVSKHLKVTPEMARQACEEVMLEYSELKGVNELKGHAKAVDYIKRNFKLVTNRIKGKTVVFSKKGEKTNWNQFTLYNEVKLAGISASTSDINAIWNDPNMHQIYDPIKDYFEALPKHKPGDQTIADLMGFLKFSSDTPPEWAHQMIRKHMIRAVWQIYESGYANRYCIVFASKKERIGKSLLVDFLNPLGMEYTANARENNKDQLVKIVENFFVVFDEIDKLATSPSQNAWLKSFISTQYIQERKTYRLDNEAMKRNATIWGTTNRPFLDAENENSRYVVMAVEEIDWQKYTKMININHLWAEAYQAYLNGEKGELTDQEQAIQYALQEDWNIYRDVYHIAKIYINRTDSDEPSKTAIELINELEYYQITGRKPIDVGGLERALTKLGFPYKIENRIKHWQAKVDTDKRRSAIFAGATSDVNF